VAPIDRGAFPLAVMAGDPELSGAVLWTRAQGPGPLRLETAIWVRGAWEAQPSVEVPLGPDGYTHHRWEGGAPDQAVAYQWVDASGAGSAVGAFRTALPDDDRREVSFAAVSCLHQEHEAFRCLSEVRRLGPLDFFLWLGDTVYCDGSRTVEDYRAVWAQNLTTETFQGLLTNTNSCFTWDDHEIDNNWDPDTYPEDVREAGFQAFFETIPLLPATPRRLWRSFRYGKTAEVFVLDCRSERLEGDYVSEEQLAWLIEGLSRSEAVWKVIANSVPIADMPPAWDVAGARDDRWEGHPAQRDRLLDAITEGGLRGVLFVSGDLHQTTLNRVEASGPRASLLEAQAGPGGSFPNIAAILMGDNEQFLYNDAQWSSTRISLRSDGTARLVAVREDGLILFEAEVTDRGDVTFETVVHPT
jgi:alkaline phosphatase D